MKGFNQLQKQAIYTKLHADEEYGVVYLCVEREGASGGACFHYDVKVIEFDLTQTADDFAEKAVTHKVV